jgi:gamma-glutamyltranspeptidase/glutathione hydrolase
MVDEERAARDTFYKGDLAATIADYHRLHEGWMTREDLAGFESEFEPPVRTLFHGLEVYTCGV